MIECEHVESQVWKKPDFGVIRCRVLCEATGIRCSCYHKVCEQCLASGLAESPTTDPRWIARFKGALASRLVSGDSPHYAGSETFDMIAAFGKFVELAVASRERDARGRFTNEIEAKALLRRMFAWQTGLSEERDGHPVAVLVEKFCALAEAHNMTNELEEIIAEYEHAQRTVDYNH